MERDQAYLDIIQELLDRGYEKKETGEPDPNFEIYESPDVEVQVFFQSGSYAPRARTKSDGRILVFSDLIM